MTSTPTQPIVVNYSHVRHAVDGLMDEARYPSDQLTDEDRALLGNAMAVLQDAEGSDPSVLTAPDDQVAAIFQSELARLAISEGKFTKAADASALEARFDHHDWHWIKLVLAEVREKLHLAERDRRPDLSSEIVELPENARLAILGDWGTGLYGAVPAANSVAEDGDYDGLLHLGDIYYSGSDSEVHGNFLTPWKIMTDGNPRALSRACVGNHEMYSGGGDYYEYVLPAFDQPSSVFAAKTKDWLLVGLDTAYRDHDLDAAQVTWLTRLLASNPQQRVMLFSHHPPFSQLSDQGDTLVSRLKSHFASGRIVAWYWGHEHLFAAYDRTDDWPFHGRCVGHGGFPYNRGARLSDAPKTDLAEGLAFRLLPARGMADDPNHPIIPRARILDGPNEYVGDAAQNYGPNGYLRLEIAGPSLRESLMAPNGTILWSAELT